MKKSFHNTLILLAVFVGLLGWYFLYEKKLKPQQTEKEEQAKVLLTTPRESVQELVVLQRQGDEKSTQYRTLQFKKVGNDWNIVQPVEDLGEPGAVAAMVTTATTAKQDRVVDEKPVALEPYGLANPKIKILVKKDSQSPSEELWVGSDTPVGSSVYAKVAGKDTVYRAALTLRTTFDKEVSDYRNKKVMPFSRADVQEAEIRTPSESFILKLGEADKWILSREGLPAADLEVNKTLNAVLDMQATGFATDKAGNDLSKWGLSSGAVSLAFKKKDGQQLLTLGKVKDKYYAKRGDKAVVYEIAKDVFDKASRPAKEYRDLKLVTFNRFDVRRIKVEHGPQSYELVKDATQWAIPSDPAAKIDGNKVEDYLSRLQDIKIQGFLGATDKPKSPEITVRLFDKKDGKETEVVTLKVAKPADGRATAERNGLDRGFTLGETEFKKVNAFKQEFLAASENKEKK